MGPDQILSMSDEKNDFMFACTSINTTFKLQKYFHLADYINFENDRKDIGSRMALKNFC